MSSQRLNRNFQIFLQSIYDWPTPTIEKSTLIAKLEQLCRQNPELEHIYENVPMLPISDLVLNRNPDENSPLPPRKIYHNRPLFPTNESEYLTTTNGNHVSTNGPNLIQNITVAKEGDLTVRKGSVVLLPLLKKYRLKSPVYCELSYMFTDNKKIVHFGVYQNRRCRKLIHKFIIDNTCSFVLENKKDFIFKHNSVVEKFTTETGVADAWILSFDEANMVRQQTDEPNTENEYENPSDLFSNSGSSSLDSTRETPAKPPPRLILPTNSISPEKIYVCLYNHRPTTNSNELEFNCGDLLYILDANGPNFYIGYRLIPPLTDLNQTPKGLVFKDYITPAYEKVS